MGVRKTADFLEKSTWTLAGAILLLCVVATATIPRSAKEVQSRLRTQIDNTVDPNAIPTLPTAVPPASTTTPPSGDQTQK
jgi:preprotein translocase subunit SecG